MDGILNVLKPPGMTSHDVVSFARRLFRVKRIGHTGTLDPGVAGVMVLCVGKATRLVEYLLESGKAYRAELTLGVTTDTQDSFGQVLDKKENFLLDFSLVEKTVAEFRGKIEQIPPMYSAVRHQGKKLYELARDGQEVERTARMIEIKSLNLLGYKDYSSQGLIFGSKVIFDVECSKGTYIRTLCHDIGDKLGCGAYMSYLIRTQVGKFCLEDAWSLEELSSLELPEKALTSMSADLIDLPQIIVNHQGEKNLLHGRTINQRHVIEIKKSGPIEQRENFSVSDNEGNLLAIVRINDDCWQPVKVLC